MLLLSFAELLVLPQQEYSSHLLSCEVDKAGYSKVSNCAGANESLQYKCA
jgi:hypothetical protein